MSWLAIIWNVCMFDGSLTLFLVQHVHNLPSGLFTWLCVFDLKQAPSWSLALLVADRDHSNRPMKAKDLLPNAAVSQAQVGQETMTAVIFGWSPIKLYLSFQTKGSSSRTKIFSLQKKKKSAGLITRQCLVIKMCVLKGFGMRVTFLGMHPVDSIHPNTLFFLFFFSSQHVHT